jgi:pimeloyl-ACP methyl ester carboxylesterase
VDVQTFTAHRRVVETACGPVACTEVGDGPPAVLVHGVFTSGALWREVVDGVRDLRRCIAVDLPAHGRTPSDGQRDLGLTGQAEAVVALCDALGVDTFDLVANDTGGAVSQVVAGRWPDRIRSLALTNCDAHDNLPPEAFAPAVELARKGELAPLLRSLAADHDAARSPLGLGLGYEHPERLGDDVLDEYLQCVATDERAAEVERLVRSLEPGPLLAAEEGLRRLESPALVVWGTGDVFFDVSWANFLHDLLPGARDVVEVPGAKLFFPDERADALVPHLRALWGDAGP